MLLTQDFVGTGDRNCVDGAISGCQDNGKNSQPLQLVSFMPDALPVATLSVYLGLGLALRTAGYSTSDICFPMACLIHL